MSVPYVDPTVTTMKNGSWYAFDLQGFRFFATVYNNGLTGYLELTPIPDPYICKHCGLSFVEGNHVTGGTPGFHEYEARGHEAA